MGRLGVPYGEVQCIMGNADMGPPTPVDRMTDTTENITFPQLRWLAVNMDEQVSHSMYALLSKYENDS